MGARDRRDLVARCRLIATSTWRDALDVLGVGGHLQGLRRRSGQLPLAGPVVTVEEAVGPLGSAAPSEFGIERILSEAESGQVVLIRQRGEPPASALGGLAALAARQHGVAGFIIDGACRDVDELTEIDLPVISREVTPASGRGRVRIVSVNAPLPFGSLQVLPGDLAVADETGVVVLPAARLEELLPLAEERAQRDAEEARRLRG